MLRLAAALTLALAAPVVSAAELVGQLSRVDQQQVEATAAEADANWNARNAAGLASMYAREATLLVGGRGPVLTGMQDVQEYFAASFARTPAAMRHTTSVDRLVVLAPNLVLADTRVALDKVAPDGSSARVRDFSTVTVLSRQANGEWKFQSVRAYPVAPVSTGAPAAQN